MGGMVGGRWWKGKACWEDGRVEEERRIEERRKGKKRIVHYIIVIYKGWLASAKLRSLVEVILARPIRGQDFKFSFNVIFLSTTDVNYVGDEGDPRPALQEVDQHV